MSDKITDESLSDIAGRPVDANRLSGYSPKLIEAIAAKFPAESIVDLLDSLVKAKIVTKGGHEIADNRTRLAAATLMLNYLVGRPVERTENINVNVDAATEDNLVERLAKSPALRQSLKRAIEKAEGAIDV
jgi:hypothetical protein